MSAKKTTATKKAAKSKVAKPAAKKPTKAPGKNGDAKPKKLSALDAAAKVLAPLNTRQMIEAMAKKGLWTSPGGATPHATLYSAILREVAAKGKDARFKKVDRGHFAFNG